MLPKSPPTPTEINFAKITDVPGIKKALGNGGRLIDVRSAASFSTGHDPQAINIPYKKNEMAFFASLPKFQDVDQFDVKKIPGPIDKRIVFIGESEDDIAPVRAALLAKHAGFKKISWLRGGEAERRSTAAKGGGN